MPRGVKNTPPTPPSVAPAPTAEPTPLIMLQPHGDGIQFNAYGMEIPEIVDALRLAIVHMVGKQAGVTMFDEMISRSQRVWVPKAPAATPRIVPTVSNGKKPGKSNAKISRLPRFDDESDLRDDLAAELADIDRELA